MGEGKGGMIWENGIETCMLSYMKWIVSPGSMHETGARGWCTGKTQREGMGREVRGGFRMGNICTPMADSCQCVAKPLQYYKVISLQLKQINLLKKRKQFLKVCFLRICDAGCTLCLSLSNIVSLH